MTTWIESLTGSLDELHQPLRVFFRDDDVGPADERFYRLLDLFSVYEAPIDVAVIPDVLESRVGQMLAQRQRENPALLGLHQHGFRHTNHSPVGRKCEFGNDRSRESQMHDILAGWTRLRAAFGPAVDPIFTPPWNRCSQDTVLALQTCGFEALSREIFAQPLELGALVTIDVTLDWCKPARPEPIALQRAVASCIAGGRSLGIMLHHAVMHEESIEALEQVLDVLSRHRNVRLVTMRALLRRRSNAGEPPRPPVHAPEVLAE